MASIGIGLQGFKLKRQNSGGLSGVQLWAALPDAVRNGAADFQHVAETPTVTLHGGMAQVFAGTLGGGVSPFPAAR